MSDPLDIIGICKVQHAGVVATERRRMVLNGPPVRDTGRRTVVTPGDVVDTLFVTLGDEGGWAWEIEGEGLNVGYEPHTGDWFGSNDSALESGFSAATTVVVSTTNLGGVGAFSIHGFGWNPIAPRKLLMNLGPHTISLRNGWVGTPDEGSMTEGPSTLRVRQDDDQPFQLAPNCGVRLFWDSVDSRWVVDSTQIGTIDGTVFFVDSVDGDDEADGLSPVSAFQTLSRVAEELDDDLEVGHQHVLLKRGSRFREELTGWPAGLHVRAYGSGARPIIDGRDIADNDVFTKTGGRTNVYEIAWTHDFAADGGKSAHRVWEEDVMMTRAASLAACDSTPGSFYAAAPTSGGPDTVYFHPSDSSNPITNEREYALTQRRWCVQLYNSYLQAHVTGLETIGNAYADGSLCIDGYVEDCVAKDGRIHNAFILGEAVGCQALRTEAGINSTMFVTYKDASSFGPNGRSTLFRNCLADAQASMTGVSGYYMHTDGVHLFGTIEYRDCRAVGCDSGWGGIQAAKVVTYRCTYEDVVNAFSFVGIENFILGGTGKTRGGFVDGGLIYVNTGAPVSYVVHGCKVLQHSGFGPVFLYVTGGTVSVERCTFATDVGGLIRCFRGEITFRRNVVAYGNVNCMQLHYWTDPIDGFDADFNCYWNPVAMGGSFQYLYPTPTYVTNLADWQTYLAAQALGAGVDANSIAQDPNIPGYMSLDFAIENAAVLAMDAGAEVDEEDDPELQAYWLEHRVTAV